MSPGCSWLEAPLGLDSHQASHPDSRATTELQPLAAEGKDATDEFPEKGILLRVNK